MIKDLSKSLFTIGAWLLNPANRLRLMGARIEVIAFITARFPCPSILLVQSVYENIWMPPQEGVKLVESFQDAFFRCVQEECNLFASPDQNQQKKLIYLRNIQYLATVNLPINRQKERLVADDATDTFLSHIPCTKKSYWAAIAILKNTSDITPVPNGNEITKVGWFSFEKARNLIQNTNRTEKANILFKGIELCEKCLYVV